MLLRHLGDAARADAVERAVDRVLALGEVRTPDLGGSSSTEQVGAAVIETLRARPLEPTPSGRRDQEHGE
jgi:tartrate dehydrogenase/decarboxylase/D-malate dehydrogenase